MKKYLIILSTIFLLLISAIIIFLTYISKKTSRPLLYFPKIFVQNILTKSAPDKLNLVVLGVDRRDDWLEKTETTDTVIFSQINFIQNKAGCYTCFQFQSGRYCGSCQPCLFSYQESGKTDKFVFPSRS